MVSENERRAKMINTINNEIVKNGFKSLTMDSIAKVMGVSRGKLYQYFSSKDEVIEAVVARYIRYIEEKMVKKNLKNDQNFVDEFISIFFQNVTLAGSSSEIFINDLKNVYPHFHQRFSDAMSRRNLSIEAFYESGIEAGIFNQNMNVKLLQLQDQTMIATLVVPQFLFTHRLEPDQTMRDYLVLRILEIIHPKFQHLVNQEMVESQINHLAEKFTSVFWA